MFTNILLTVDLAHLDTQMPACQAAASLAGADGAKLHVLSVVPDFGRSLVGSFFPADFEEKALEKAHQQLVRFTGGAFAAGLVTNHIVRHGNVYREIMAAADEEACDLIIISAHRPELKDYLLGPNAARVVRHARQSVMVVRDN